MFLIDGKIIKGDAVSVVQQMMENVYDSDRFDSLDEYMIWLSRSVWRFHGAGINVIGETLEARCESLLAQLQSHELLKSAE